VGLYANFLSFFEWLAHVLMQTRSAVVSKSVT
jgi:hypothetical protein